MEKNSITSNADYSNSEEIKIWDLFKILWIGRKKILVVIVVLTLIGVFHVTNGPVEYESESVLISEGSSDISPSQRFLQTLGGNFGFPLRSGSTQIESGLLPSILDNLEFKYDLIKVPIEFSAFNESISIMTFSNEYFVRSRRERVYNAIRNYTIMVPFRIIDWVSSLTKDDDDDDETEYVEIDNRIFQLNSNERRAIGFLNDRIFLTMDGNIIRLKTIMPDRKAAAMLNVIIIERVKEYLINFHLEKARQNLSFTLDQKEEARINYERSQEALAEFRDQNINLRTNIAMTEDERLSNQRNLTFNIYNSIAVEYEQAKLRIQEETPLFSVIQRSNYPTAALGGSNRIILVYPILGLFAGIALVFGLEIYKAFKINVFDE